MTPSLKANDVGYAVDGKTLISGVNIDLRGGAMLAIVGPNGAGKSTLCGALAGDLRPFDGDVEVCGEAVRDTKPASLAKLRSMLTQHTPIRFPFTAREVVMMGRYPHIRRWRSPTEFDFNKVEEAMESTQSLHLADRIYPTLSGGEQRRVSLARVLAQDAPVILLDEPTNALDIAHQQLAMTLCRRLADEGRVIVSVLHDVNLAAQFADLVMIISRGQVVAVGEPEDVLTHSLLSQVFGMRVIVIPHPETGKPVALASSGGVNGHREKS